MRMDPFLCEYDTRVADLVSPVFWNQRLLVGAPFVHDSLTPFSCSRQALSFQPWFRAQVSPDGPGHIVFFLARCTARAEEIMGPMSHLGW